MTEEELYKFSQRLISFRKRDCDECCGDGCAHCNQTGSMDGWIITLVRQAKDMKALKERVELHILKARS